MKKNFELVLNCCSKLRILFAATAFSMGVDRPDIINVIYCGSPSMIKHYIQKLDRLAEMENQQLLYCMESLGSTWMKQ